MSFERVRQWRGTADGLATALKRTNAELGLKVAPPTVRTIRLWRTRRLLTQGPTLEFGFRQILESFATALLRAKGWTLAAIAELLPSLSDAAIEANILADASGAAV